MNSTARKAEQERNATAGLDPELLETEEKLRNALRYLGAHEPLMLSVGLAPLVHGWIQRAAALNTITPAEIETLAPTSIPFQPDRDLIDNAEGNRRILKADRAAFDAAFGDINGPHPTACECHLNAGPFGPCPVHNPGASK